MCFLNGSISMGGEGRHCSISAILYNIQVYVVNTLSQFKLSLLWKAVWYSSCFRLLLLPLTVTPFMQRWQIRKLILLKNTASCLSNVLNCGLWDWGEQNSYGHKAPHSCPPFSLSWPYASVSPFACTLVFLATTQEAPALTAGTGGEMGMCCEHKLSGWECPWLQHHGLNSFKTNYETKF